MQLLVSSKGTNPAIYLSKKEKLSYYRYANELHQEVYGNPLENRDYDYNELYQIIRKCETIVRTKYHKKERIS